MLWAEQQQVEIFSTPDEALLQASKEALEPQLKLHSDDCCQGARCLAWTVHGFLQKTSSHVGGGGGGDVRVCEKLRLCIQYALLKGCDMSSRPQQLVAIDWNWSW